MFVTIYIVPVGFGVGGVGLGVGFHVGGVGFHVGLYDGPAVVLSFYCITKQNDTRKTRIKKNNKKRAKTMVDKRITTAHNNNKKKKRKIYKYNVQHTR